MTVSRETSEPTNAALIAEMRNQLPLYLALEKRARTAERAFAAYYASDDENSRHWDRLVAAMQKLRRALAAIEETQ